MSMFDPTARSRRNPLQSAKEFIANEPLVRPNTFSGEFQPAINPYDDPMAASEQAAADLQTIKPDFEQADESQDYTVRFAEAQRQRQALERQQQEQQQFGNYQTASANYGGSTGQGVPGNIGNLSQSRQQVVRETARYAGTPYQLGGRTARGIDCSGLVMAVYNQAGFNVSQHSAGWQGRNIPGVRTSLNNLQPGDIVAWRDGSHIAIYAGNGMIWDASRSKGTSLRPLWTSPTNVYGIKLRFPGER